MEESLSSIKTHSRKRKEYPPPTPFSGRLTRNKSQIYAHHNRSGRARLDGFLRKPISIPYRSESKKVDLDESRDPSNTLQGSCIKDLRRQRVSIPEVNSDVEDVNKEEDMSTVKELLKVPNVVSGQIPDLGVRDLELDGSPIKVISEEVIEEIPDLDIVKSQIEEKEERPNEGLLKVSASDPVPDAGRILDPVSDPSHQNSKDVTVSGNFFISKAKATIVPCKRRKVFVTPSSFSYRRLLPYLNNMVDEEYNVGIFNAMQKPVGINSEACKVNESASNYKVESFSDGCTEHLVSLSLPCNTQDLSGGGNELDQLSEMIIENLASQMDASLMEEESSQTTPDPEIISIREVGSSGETTEHNTSPTENQILEEVSERDILKESESSTTPNNRMEEDKRGNVGEGMESLKISDADPDRGRVSDSIDQEAGQINKADQSSNQKSNDETNSGNGSIPNAKLVVGPCKRRKVFIAPSSFNYRRLLPYLNNVTDDDYSISKLGTVDAPISDTLQKPVDVNSEACPVADNASISEEESHSDHTKPLETEDQTKEKIKKTEVGEESLASRTDGSLMEEDSIQMTPPDSDLVLTMNVRVDAEINLAENLSPEHQVHEDFTVVEEISNNASLKVVNKSTSPNNRMGLSPCRLRVFKNTKSFSYRRLLPFLTDMAKNDSSDSTTIQQQKPVFESKEDTPSLSLLSSTTDENHVNEMLTPFSNENSDTHLFSDTTPPAIISPLETNNSFTTIRPSTIENSSDIEPIQLLAETTPELDQLITPRNLESEFLETESSDVDSVHNKIEDPIEHIHDALVTPASMKGILKRNPRGCRGPCNCLNCASFRLHSERAFEFSLNQLRDAEEIASELMKEMASLRQLLEKENDFDITGLDSNSVEVRQACDKALEKENWAKDRISQLNYELSIHCRVPDLVQPGVTFANYVQEKTIPRLPRK